MAVAKLNPSLGMKTPIKNTLFENAKLDKSLRRISFVQDTTDSTDTVDHATNINDEQNTIQPNNISNYSCECKEGDLFLLFATITQYFDSAVRN